VKSLFAAAAVGCALGSLASKMLFLQWVTVVPWGVAALLVGLSSASRRASIANGTAFGLALGLLFMAGGYAGADPMVTRLPFFASIAIVSAVPAVLLSVTGHLIWSRVRRA
jgi:hypothetical protein